MPFRKRVKNCELARLQNRITKLDNLTHTLLDDIRNESLRIKDRLETSDRQLNLQLTPKSQGKSSYESH